MDVARANYDGAIRIAQAKRDEHHGRADRLRAKADSARSQARFAEHWDAALLEDYYAAVWAKEMERIDRLYPQFSGWGPPPVQEKEVG